jgi:hypothetical protein
MERDHRPGARELGQGQSGLPQRVHVAVHPRGDGRAGAVVQ